MLGSRGIDNIQTSDARGNKEWHRNNLAQYMVHILYVYVFICACASMCECRIYFGTIPIWQIDSFIRQKPTT